MSHDEAIREEIMRASEIFAFYFWEKVVGIINNILSSESLPSQYMWGVSPKEVVVNLVKVWRGEGNPTISSREDGYIDVKFDAYIQLERAVRWGEGEGFPLILYVTHEWLLREGKPSWVRWVSHVQVKRWYILSSTGKGRLAATPELSLVGPLGDNALPLFMIGREHLDSRTLQFITRTILVLYSPQAVDLRFFVFNITQCVLKDFHRLLHTVWELPRVKRYNKLYARVLNVNVPKKSKYEWLYLGFVDSEIGTLPGYVHSWEAELRNIELYVEFLTEKGESLMGGVVVVDAEIRVELGKPTKNVDLSFIVNYRSFRYYGKWVTFTLFEFNDLREIPMMGYVDLFQYPKFIEAIRDGLREIFNYLVK